MQNPSLSVESVSTQHEEALHAQGVTQADLDEAWFDAPPPSTRRSSVPPPPVSAVGEFLGDPLADSWLR